MEAPLPPTPVALYRFAILLAGLLWLLARRLAVYLRLRSAAAAPTKVYNVFFVHRCGTFFGGGERVLWSIIKAAVARDKDWRVGVLLLGGRTRDELFAEVERVFGWAFTPEEQGRIDFHFIPLAEDINEKHIYTFYNFVKFVYELSVALFCASRALEEGFACQRVVESEGMTGASHLLKLLWPRTHVSVYEHCPRFFVKKRPRHLPGPQGVVRRAYDGAGRALYRRFLSTADVVIANSSWTEKHLRRLLPQKKVHLIFPPCGVERFDGTRPKQPHLVSLGHFRPSKRHCDQLRVFAGVLRRLDHPREPRLQVIGMAIGEEYMRVVADLRAMAVELKISGQVDFIVNAPAKTVRSTLEGAAFGIHTMRKEHFGIGVVEMMSAGAIVATWDEAGPRHDIIVRDGDCGLLCRSLDEFEEKLAALLRLRLAGDLAQEEAIRRRTLNDRVPAFSERIFHQRITALCFP